MYIIFGLHHEIYFCEMINMPINQYLIMYVESGRSAIDYVLN